MKIGGSGAGLVSQRYGSGKPDPDLYQNVTGPQHRFLLRYGETLGLRLWLRVLLLLPQCPAHFQVLPWVYSSR